MPSLVIMTLQPDCLLTLMQALTPPPPPSLSKASSRCAATGYAGWHCIPGAGADSGASATDAGASTGASACIWNSLCGRPLLWNWTLLVGLAFTPASDASMNELNVRYMISCIGGGSESLSAAKCNHAFSYCLQFYALLCFDVLCCISCC
jgi:hypothetical protein